MITTTNNYFQDLNNAIAAGLFPANAKPKKAALYEAIDLANAEAAAEDERSQDLYDTFMGVDEPTDQPETAIAVQHQGKAKWDLVEVDRFDLPEGIYRCDLAQGFDEWNTKAQAFLSAHGTAEMKGDVHSGYVLYSLQRVQSDVAALEAAGDEAAVQAALMAMDAVEDAQPKKQKPPSKLDLLAQAIADGIEDVEQLAAISGMKPQGVKGWVGVIKNRGLDNWKAACKKSA